MNSIAYKDSDKSYRLNYNTFNLKGVNFPVIRFPVTNKNINFTINVNIKNEYTTNLLDVYYTITGAGTTYIKKSLENGINNISYVIPEEDEPTHILIAWRDNTTNVDVDIEFIPDYKGALVSDGVDDYGLCENFPILTKERGYTVCAIRKLLNSSKPSCLISKRKHGSSHNGAFEIERITENSDGTLANITYSFGQGTYFNSNNNLFTFQKSNLYNSTNIKVGNQEDTDVLCLFISLYNIFTDNGQFAFYAKEIYDMDLTDEEIALVKERMIKRYEEKTGETYVEEVTV